MFEHKTYENIMQSMTEKVGDKVDTREGSVIWDAMSPMALALAEYYSDLDRVLNECFADTSSFYYLIKKAAERCITPNPASRTVVRLQTTPGYSDSPAMAVGDKISTGNHVYTIIDVNAPSINTSSKYSYDAACDTAGDTSDDSYSAIVAMQDTLKPVESVFSIGVVTYGADEETEESLRKRYIDSFRVSSFGGNRVQYRDWVRDTGIVEDLAVDPFPDEESGQIKLYCIGKDFKELTEDQIKTVQTHVDPDNSRLGTGIVPIGHTVKISKASAVTLYVCGPSGSNTWATLKSGYTIQDLMVDIKEDMDKLVERVRSEWAEPKNATFVRLYVQNINKILNGVEYVTDYDVRIAIKYNGTITRQPTNELEMSVGEVITGWEVAE